MAMSCCVDQVNALEDKIYTVFLFCFFSSIFLHFSSCWSFYLVLLVIIFTPTSGILSHIAPGIDFSDFAICDGIFTIDVTLGLARMLDADNLGVNPFTFEPCLSL